MKLEEGAHELLLSHFEQELAAREPDAKGSNGRLRAHSPYTPPPPCLLEYDITPCYSEADAFTRHCFKTKALTTNVCRAVYTMCVYHTSVVSRLATSSGV